MTRKARLTQLERHRADAFIALLAHLDTDAFHARLAAMTTEPAPYLRGRIRNECVQRFRLMSEEALEVFLRAHSTPEEYARLQAMSDAELEAMTMGA